MALRFVQLPVTCVTPRAGNGRLCIADREVVAPTWADCR